MVPFTSLSYAYVFTTNMYEVDLATGIVTDLGPLNPPNTLNALGYNILDGYIYGYDITTNNICKVSFDGIVQDLFSVPGLPSYNYTVGDIDQNGYYHFIATDSIVMYVVDLNQARASTYGKLVNPLTKAISNLGTTITGSIGGSSIRTGDWAFNPRDGQIYYPHNIDGRVRRIDPLTGVVTLLSINIATPGMFNSTVFGPNNDMYSIDNQSAGNIYRYIINLNSATISLFSSIAYSLNPFDAARYSIAPIYFASIINPVQVASEYVVVGETITYTITLNNNGNSDALDFILFNTIVESNSFINNSINLNGDTIVGSPLYPSGVNLGTIPIGINTVTFQVKVDSIPSINPIQNSSYYSYKFLDPTTIIPYSRAGNSTVAVTTISNISMSASSSVSSLNAKLGDILTYTISYTSTGNVSTNSVDFMASIPNGATYLLGSLEQDGINILGNIAYPGVPLINQFENNDLSTIAFQVQLITIPSPNLVSTSFALNYSYIANPITGETRLGNIISFSNGTSINDPVISAVKSVDKNFVQMGDTLTYTVVIKNSGNVDAVNVRFIDTIPVALTYIGNTFMINGVQQGVLTTTVIALTIPNVIIGATLTVTFKTVVNTIPTSNNIANSSGISYNYTGITTMPNAEFGSVNSNTTTSTINEANINIRKLVDKNLVRIGDTVTYSLIMNNTGNTIANSVIIDTIPTGTTFINNSVKLNGIIQVGATVAPPSGFTLNNIQSNNIYTLTFSVVCYTNPSGDIINNLSHIGYNYTQYPTIANGNFKKSTSNIVSTTVVRNTLDISKIVNPVYSIIGETLTFTIIVKNTGNVDVINGVIIDTLPNSVSFIMGSIIVNGMQQGTATPSTGINVGTIAIGETSTITFKSRVL